MCRKKRGPRRRIGVARGRVSVAKSLRELVRPFGHRDVLPVGGALQLGGALAVLGGRLAVLGGALAVRRRGSRALAAVLAAARAAPAPPLGGLGPVLRG